MLVHTMDVLNLSTLLMSLYGTYSMGWAVNDLYQGRQIEAWAEAGMAGFGLLLAIGALIARTGVPGGLPITAAGLLGLQAVDVHNAAHLDTPLWLQVVRALVSATLLAMAFYGGRPRRR
ncbi:MAG: hypothetical protein ABL961_03085 [Vicinamibacterales bacterium]